MTRTHKRTIAITLLFVLFTTLFVVPLSAQDTGGPMQPEPTFTLHDMRGYLAYAGVPYASIAAASCMPAQEPGQFVWCLVPLDGDWVQWLVVWRTGDWRMHHTLMQWCEGDCG